MFQRSLLRLLLFLPHILPRQICPESSFTSQLYIIDSWILRRFPEIQTLVFIGLFDSFHFSISSANIYWHWLFARHHCHTPEIDCFVVMVKSNNQNWIKLFCSISDNSPQWTRFWKRISGILLLFRGSQSTASLQRMCLWNSDHQLINYTPNPMTKLLELS